VTTIAPSRPIRVLIADDTASVRLLLHRTLGSSELFAIVGEATDGRQAIELAIAEQPDVILLDLDMPVMDGFEAIPELISVSPGSLIIVLSGLESRDVTRRVLALGAHGYIGKKLGPDQLLAKIAEMYRLFDIPGAANDRGRVEAAALETHNRFRLAFAHAPIGTAFVGLDGRLLEVNQAFCRLTGYAEANLLGRLLDDLRDPEDVAVDSALMTQLLAGEVGSYQSEKHFVRADGTRISVMLSRSVLVDHAGRPELLVTHVSDSPIRRGRCDWPTPSWRRQRPGIARS
jgi:PAS domain S-box-containing protein